jgi:hypothetical protein
MMVEVDPMEQMRRFEEIRRRDRMIDAIYKTGTVVALGSTFYLGCFLYRYFTDVQISVKQALGSVVAEDWPPVDPSLGSDEASAAYAVVLGVDPKAMNTQIAGWVSKIVATSPLMGAGFAIADRLVETPGSVAYQKWSRFNDARHRVGDDGSFTGFTAEYNVVCEAWRELYKSGFSRIDPTKSIHPVDAFTSFVVNDKWYWGGVLALSAAPIVGISIEELKRVEREVTAGR